ncbi:3-ketoacyl-CoA thiolase [Roseomonas mucosa]|uniref:thiolase family protein n=1 Tax=Roseomonas mucosa TaxID=207340 RepID=UPI0024C56F71|nr:thiolase family protein [Roseomonas mucosa]QDD93328.1 3-ketoacyl-CoA thiolase [Roseomonas mucosa]
MTDVVIAAYRRSPFHFAGKGELARVRPDELVAQVMRALLAESKADPAAIEDVVMGCAFPEGEQGLNIARLASFLAGLPQAAGGVTVNRFCGSSMQAVHQAAGAIRMGAGKAFLCAGVESMSRVPIMGFNPLPHPGLAKDFPQAYISMGETAENVARRHQIPRREQEEFAAESQRRAAKAQAEGYFASEIVPIRTRAGTVEQDGCIRPDTTPEGLAGLKPAFSKDGTVTAGTSSPLTDGAAALLVCSGEHARSRGMEPLARIRGIAVAGCAPEIMGMGPVEASRKALARAGIGVGDLDVVELNEAFASQSIACIRELGLDPALVNIDGGAIALGHPLGATGARIVGKAAALLRRQNGRYALATQCIGGGQGIATVLEAVE